MVGQLRVVAARKRAAARRDHVATSALHDGRAVPRWRRLRQWWAACWRPTLAIAGLTLAGIVLLASGYWPDRMVLPLAIIVALLPLAIPLVWMMNIPAIWNVHAGWLALVSLMLSILWAVLGHWYAALQINQIFTENPAFFPVAKMVGTYLGAILAAMSVYALVGLAITIFGATPVVVIAIWALPDWRRSLRWLGALAFIVFSAAFTKAAIAPIETLTGQAIRWTALNADFVPLHRCDRSGWPQGITRVLFIGDQQVLGYDAPSDQFPVLPCIRTNAPV